MKYIETFNESIRHLKNVVKGDRKMTKQEIEWLKKQDLYFENAYVVNGAFFPYGVKEIPGKIIFPDKSLKNEMKQIISETNEFFKNDMIIPIWYDWIFNTWMIKEPLLTIQTPSYLFQVPVYTKEKAIEIAEFLTEKFKKQSVIAISGGWVLPNKKMPGSSQGDAYVKSGRFIDRPDLLKKYWNKENRIFFID